MKHKIVLIKNPIMNVFRLALLTRSREFFEEAERSGSTLGKLEAALKNPADERSVDEVSRALNQVLTKVLELGGSLVKVS